MRIAYLNPSGQLGGAETSLREILSAVRATEPDWELWLILGQDGPLANQARQLGVQVKVVPFPRGVARIGESNSGRLTTLLSLIPQLFGVAAYVRRLSHVLKEVQASIIHTNGLKMHVLGALAHPKGSRLVWHIHDYVSRRPVMRYALHWLSESADSIIANSYSVASDVRSVLPDSHVVTIHNAVDLERFTPDGPRLDLDALAQLPPASPGTIRVGLVATFARWKGHLQFLKALAEIGTEMPVRGYVIGGPIYETSAGQWSERELRENVRTLGLEDRVGFTGFVKDTPAAMRALDVVVHASTEPEPFGMVLIEAMACGRAPIASPCGGAAEIIEDGVTALAHETGSSSSLSIQIRRLASNQEQRQVLGRNARKMVERKFHKAKLGREVTELYRNVLSPSFERDVQFQTSAV